ncbi:EpsG family protein [Vibrio sp. AIC-3]|uniref:EpsG family protein n=1 Tax=Vibrio sp. AIC-3 TaxID=2607604 RepID=UPI00168E4C44|nr:EpsG family protein [Vibrio sp. AIC-3]
MIIPYLFITQLIIIFSFVRKNVFDYAIFFVLMIFFCTTYFNGSDWRIYELLYNDESLFNSYQHWGIGTELVFSTFRIFGFNFHEMLILVKFFVFSVCFWYANKYSKTPVFTFSIFLMLSGYGIFIDNPFRQMLAIPFFLISNIFIIRRSFLGFALCLWLGSFLHTSILLFLPIYFLSMIRLNNKYLIFLIITSYLMSLSDSILYTVVDSLGKFVPIISFYARHYLEGEGRFFNISTLIYLSVVFIVYYKSDKVNFSSISRESSTSDNLNTIYFFLYVLCVILSMRIPDILRFTYYFGLPFAVFVSTRVSFSISRKIYVLIVCSVLSINLILSEYKYVPYTNYIYSRIFDQLKDYNYRNSYHYIYHRDL